jgi:c-di-AMP phosphodiesterase-like protein
MKVETKIKHRIKKSKNIFIVAHQNLDLDAIGACIGMSSICTHFHKKSYIIVDDTKHELGVSKLLKEIENSYTLIKSSDIPKYYQKNSILVIVDTNKAHLLQNDKILHYFNHIIILDHHQESDQTINCSLKIINEQISSACEIITNLIEKYKVNIDSKTATFILSGIVLDTCNFTVKTNSNTYQAAYYLTENKADPKKVQYYLKQDIKDYIVRQKVITEVKVMKDKYAVSVAPAKIKYTLLQFNNIEASFVLGNRIDGGIGLSARSEGLVNVGNIAEMLGGGGDNHDAAAQIKDKTLTEVEEELISLIEAEEK